MEPHIFFTKAEVFAATEGLKRAHLALLEDHVSPSWSRKLELTYKEEELLRQDDEAKRF